MARDFVDQVSSRMPGQKLELIATEHKGHGEELAYEIAKSSENPLIMSSSGDGGYHDVINGVMKAQLEGHTVACGLLPAGNANDHFHNLHDGDLVERIVENKPLKIDLIKVIGQVDGHAIERYAHSYVGFGLTPFVAVELNKNKLNPFMEAWIVLKSLFTIRSIRLEIEGQVRHYDSVVFSNVNTMSKYLRISDKSSMMDGEFEITAFRRRSRLMLIRTLLRASLRGIKEDRRTNRFTLRTIDQTLVQADGEVVALDPQSEVVITTEPLILTCFI